MTGSAGQQRINPDFVADWMIALPPLTEQAAIVAYLDRKTADIERFISKKKQLIAMLNEQKATIINRAVTKGLNPDAPMKASGVEWLGEVPAHSTMTPLKRVTHLQTGITLGKMCTGTGLTTRHYLRVANVQEGYFNLSDVKMIELPEDDIDRYELRPDDVLVTEGGDPDKLGRGFVWSGEIDGSLQPQHRSNHSVGPHVKAEGGCGCQSLCAG